MEDEYLFRRDSDSEVVLKEVPYLDTNVTLLDES